MPSIRTNSVAISAPYSVVSTRRRQRKQYAAAIQSSNIATIGMPTTQTNGITTSSDDDDYYDQHDNGNSSSCGEEEPYSRRHHHSRRRRKFGGLSTGWRCRYNGTSNSGNSSSSRQQQQHQGIPRHNNIRIRNLVDRINQEIHKIKRKSGISFVAYISYNLKLYVCAFPNIILGVDASKCINLQVNPRLVDLSDFECVLCYRTLWKPVVTPCGHTYCLVSIVFLFSIKFCAFLKSIEYTKRNGFHGS